MKRPFIAVFLGLLFTSFSIGSIAQTAAVTFDSTIYRNGIGTRGTYGWDFTLQNPIRVTALGVLDSPLVASTGESFVGDGLTESHAVGIWRFLQPDVPILAAIVAEGTAAMLQDGFRYVPVTPTDLPAGQYVIAMFNTGGAATGGAVFDYSVLPTWSFPNFTPQTHLGLTIGTRRFGDSLSLSFPNLVDSENMGDFGANMLIEPVPEPSITALAILGALSLTSLAKRKRTALTSSRERSCSPISNFKLSALHL